jgi:molybdate transport system substrate-binding protein
VPVGRRAERAAPFRLSSLFPPQSFQDITMSRFSRTAVALALSWLGTTTIADAADIKALLPLSFQHSAEQLVPQFEQSSANKVKIEFGTAGAVANKVRNGEAAEVLISTAAQIQALQKDGKVVAGSNVGIVKVGVGVLVKKGAPKPDISTADKFKAAVLAAKAIAYTDPALGGPAGIYVAKLLDQLGVGAEMKSKTKLAGPGAAVSTVVVNGEADLGFIMVNEIVVDQRVELVGPLPAAIQDYTSFAAGVVAAGSQQEAGRAFIAFLSSPSSLAVMEKAGFEKF